jgi:hypothetical protein
MKGLRSKRRNSPYIFQVAACLPTKACSYYWHYIHWGRQFKIIVFTILTTRCFSILDEQLMKPCKYIMYIPDIHNTIWDQVSQRWSNGPQNIPGGGRPCPSRSHMMFVVLSGVCIHNARGNMEITIIYKYRL